MNRLFALLLVSVAFILSPTNSSAQDFSCNELMSFAKRNGYKIGNVGPMSLYDSSWLKNVDAYKVDNTIVVIASIKQDEWGISSKDYIFCGVPKSNWDRFNNAFSDWGTSYGERFHKYIYNYACNCY